MSLSYFVVVDRQGRPGLAATDRSVVTADEPGSKVVQVEAANAYLARRKASAAWQESGSDAAPATP